MPQDAMTQDFMLSRLAAMLARSTGPVDIAGFIKTLYPRDMEASRLLQSAFEARLVRGRATFTAFTATGHISAVFTQVWHRSRLASRTDARAMLGLLGQGRPA